LRLYLTQILRLDAGYAPKKRQITAELTAGAAFPGSIAIIAANADGAGPAMR